MIDKKRWVLTHDSHELKKGEIYEDESLPAWLAGKAVPAVDSVGPSEDLEKAHEALIQENESLRAQIAEVTSEKDTLAKENADLKAKLKKA